MDANSVLVVREVSGYWPEIISALIMGFSVFGVAFIGYFFGLRTFFRKREHELILKRYLDEGIDRLSEVVDGALRVFMVNLMEASDVVKRTKDGGEANLPSKFDNFERRDLTLIPFYRIKYLLGDNIFTKAVQLVLGFVDAQAICFNKDFRSYLSNIPSDPKKREELLEGLSEFLDDYFKKSEQYSLVLREMQSIASILEKETTFTWDDLGEFKNHPEVKQSVESLKNYVLNLKIQTQQPTKKIIKLGQPDVNR